MRKVISLIIALLIFASLYDYLRSVPIDEWREFLIGRYYLFQGEKDKAEKEFALALRKYPQQSEIATQIATIYMQMERWDKAEEVLKSAIKNKPSFVAYFLLGHCQLEKGERREAEKSFEKAVEMAPSNPYALNALAYLWVEENKRLEEAVVLLRRAVRKKPLVPEIWDSLGWAYVKLGEVKKGLRLLRRAVEMIPDNWEVRYHLSVAYNKLGDTASAKVEEEKARILFANEQERK
ncbi:MAG: tetratricopeptide repeat protein [bacterium]